MAIGDPMYAFSSLSLPLPVALTRKVGIGSGYEQEMRSGTDKRRGGR